ncbi:MAG TPA: Crp/Fnr family transcriptional regulator [bacterium]|nr:Crp/Fnr family transcriptional regulator [bacterium]
MTPKSFVSSLEIFKKLPSVVLAEVEKKMAEKKYAKGESLFLEGDPAENVWFVKEGHVKAVIHTAGGKDLTLCMMGVNNLFGTCCCFGGGRYPCHTVAETEVTVVSYPMQDFLSLMGKYPEMSKAVILQLSNRLRQSKDMQAFDKESVEKRILHILVNLVAEFGNTIPLTRREIAEMAGTTVETSIRTFSAFEKDGLVSSVRGKITVKNLQHLVDRQGKL